MLGNGSKWSTNEKRSKRNSKKEMCVYILVQQIKTMVKSDLTSIIQENGDS